MIFFQMGPPYHTPDRTGRKVLRNISGRDPEGHVSQKSRNDDDKMEEMKYKRKMKAYKQVRLIICKV